MRPLGYCTVTRVCNLSSAEEPLIEIGGGAAPSLLVAVGQEMEIGFAGFNRSRRVEDKRMEFGMTFSGGSSDADETEMFSIEDQSETKLSKTERPLLLDDGVQPHARQDFDISPDGDVSAGTGEGIVLERPPRFRIRQPGDFALPHHSPEPLAGKTEFRAPDAGFPLRRDHHQGLANRLTGDCRIQFPAVKLEMLSLLPGQQAQFDPLRQ